MGSLRIARAVAGVALVAAGSSACAAIWGFEDPREMTEAGTDATSGPPSTGPSSGSGWVFSDAEGDDSTIIVTYGDDGGPDGDAGADARGEAAPDPDAGSRDVAPSSCATACLAIPSGWQGPLAIFEGTGSPAPTAPACAAPYGTVAYDGQGNPDAGPAQCSCACGAPTGATCSAQMTLYSDSACTRACASASLAIGTTCVAVSTTGCAGAYFTLSAAQGAGGSCAPAATKAVPTASWQASARLCAAPSLPPIGAGCDAGTLCAPAPASPFEAQTYCIAQSGLQTCPAGFPASRVYYGAASDTRDCSPCTCASPTGSTCPGEPVVTFGTASCTNEVNSFPTPRTCTRLPNVHSAELEAGAPAGGSCTPAGGQPTGALTPTTPTTVCCTK